MLTAQWQRSRFSGLVLIGVLSVCTSSALAQGSILYYPDGKMSPCTASIYPWHNNSRREMRLQLLVPASVLPSVPTQFVDIGFSAQQPAADFTPDVCQIQIAHSSKTTFLSPKFADNLEGNVTEVYRGALHLVHKVGSWSDVRLTRSFLYDGRSSMVVDFRWKETGTVTAFIGCGTATVVVAINRLKGAYNSTSADPWGMYPGTMCKVRFKTSRAILLSGAARVRPGARIPYTLYCPPDAGLNYQVGTALGDGPIWIGNRRIGLTPDPLLAVSVQGLLPSIFGGYAGKLSSMGQASATAVVPNDQRMIGTQLHTAFVTIDSKAPSGVKSISNTVSVTVSQ